MQMEAFLRQFMHTNNILSLFALIQPVNPIKIATVHLNQHIWKFQITTDHNKLVLLALSNFVVAYYPPLARLSSP